MDLADVKEFTLTRASKDEVKTLRISGRWALGILIAIMLGLGATNLTTHGRLVALEVQIENLANRQIENNGLLKEIEGLLREGHD